MFIQWYSTIEEVIPTPSKASPLPKAPIKLLIGQLCKQKLETDVEPMAKRKCKERHKVGVMVDKESCGEGWVGRLQIVHYEDKARSCRTHTALWSESRIQPL